MSVIISANTSNNFLEPSIPVLTQHLHEKPHLVTWHIYFLTSLCDMHAFISVKEIPLLFVYIYIPVVSHELIWSGRSSPPVPLSVLSDPSGRSAVWGRCSHRLSCSDRKPPSEATSETRSPVACGSSESASSESLWSEDRPEKSFKHKYVCAARDRNILKVFR